MKKINRLVKEQSLIAFFILAYLLTWSAWIPISFGYVHGHIELKPLNIVLYIAGGFGPLLAAAIITVLSGENLSDWFLQVLKWRVSIKWWLTALFIPLVLYALMSIIHMLLGGELNWNEASLMALPGGFLSVFLWGGGNEELGWRGFALPRLQEQHNPLVSSLIIGVVWTLWHAPPGIIELGWLDWVKDLPFYMISVTGISIVATWLYNNTDGSVLLTMVFHASVNASQSLYPVEEMFSLTGELARTGAWIILACGLLLIPAMKFFENEPITRTLEQEIDAVPNTE
jgi:membrane protease YdiL (CAAX protease family)